MSFDLMRAQIKDLFAVDWKRRLLSTLLGLIILSCLIIPLSIVKVRESQGIDGSEAEAELVMETLSKINGVYFYSNIQTVDPIEMTIKINTIPMLFGELSNDSGIAKKNVSCDFHFAKPVIQENKLPQPLNFDLPIALGSFKNYPFEEFRGYIPVSCKGVEPIMAAESMGSRYVTKFNWISYEDANDEIKDYLNGKITTKEVYVAELILTQSDINRFFSVFIFLIMWGIVITLIVFSFKGIVYHQEIALPVISLGVAVLFAIPKLRDSQPGVPKFGALSDVASYYWCMVLASTSLALNLFAFSLRWRKKVNS